MVLKIVAPEFYKHVVLYEYLNYLQALFECLKENELWGTL